VTRTPPRGTRSPEREPVRTRPETDEPDSDDAIPTTNLLKDRG
jgi:hypothetical protein